MFIAVLAGSLFLKENRMETAASYVDTSDYEQLDDLYGDLFRIGVAVQAIDHWNDPTAEIGNPDKEELIAQCFNSMTFGNEFKPAYNFDPSSDTLFRVDRAAEELLTWAKEHKMPVRGHVMVWHSQVEPSIFAKDFQATSGGKVTHDYNAVLDEDCLVDRQTLIERLKTYIYGLTEYTYVNGFADVIYAWDVVNEASDEGQPDGLRRSYWYQIIGPEFLYYSFLFAREAQVKYAAEYAGLYGLDPETDDLSAIRAELFYNDYNEWYSSRSSAIIRFLTEDVYNAGQEMVQSDVIAADGDGTIFGDGLLDGIGMQGHLDDTQNLDQYMRALEAYDEAVGLVHITELDVGKTASGERGEYNQARFYYDYFSRLIEERRSGVNLESVTFWGLTDDASWRQGADPLLFYKDLGTKPAFEAVVLAAKGEAFNLQAAESAAGAGKTVIDFEPYKENGTTVTVPPASVGFYSRGSGHQSALGLTNKENHTEGAAIGFCLWAQRKEQDATVRKEISEWIGRKIRVRMYVKTADSRIVLGLEGQESLELAAADSGGDWTLLEAECEVPADWTGANLYIETDGASAIYIDDVEIEAADASDDADSAGEQVRIPDLDLEQKEVPDTEQLRFAAALKTGWNLGNTLDAWDNRKAGDNLELETAWQPVKTTPELIRAVHEAGYETIRIPVSWHNHVDGEFTISQGWLDRVQEIVDACMDEGMYVIVNIHHDNDPGSECLFPDSDHYERSERFITSIWSQLAQRFGSYDEHLIFESMNEPRLVGHSSEWNPDENNADIREAMDCINRLNQAFVNTVRAAGGNNETRYLMCPGYAASPEGLLANAFQIPEDPAEHILLSAHAYRPYAFALQIPGTDAFSIDEPSDRRDIEDFADKLYERFILQGIPVVVGETGAMDKGGNLQQRVDFAAYFTAYTHARGIPCIWWDNGAFSGNWETFAIIDRAECVFRYPQIAQAMDRYSTGE